MALFPGIFQLREGRNPVLSVEDALPVCSQFAFRPDIAVEGDRLDSEFLGELGNRGVTVSHRGPGKSNLCLGEGKLAATLPSPGTDSLESGEGAFADQFALELRQDTQADPTFRELLHDSHQVVQVAPSRSSFQTTRVSPSRSALVPWPRLPRSRRHMEDQGSGRHRPWRREHI